MPGERFIDDRDWSRRTKRVVVADREQRGKRRTVFGAEIAARQNRNMQGFEVRRTDGIEIDQGRLVRPSPISFDGEEVGVPRAAERREPRQTGGTCIRKRTRSFEKVLVEIAQSLPLIAVS